MKIELVCQICSNTFLRSASEVNRSLKLGRKFFCSRECSGKASHNHLQKFDSQNRPTPKNLRDDYTEFRYFMARANNRKHNVDINLSYLKELWEKQSGICALSGVALNLPLSTEGFLIPRAPTNASLDRIDNSLGYVIGNVRYISTIANLCRQSWSDEDVIAFAKAVTEIH